MCYLKSWILKIRPTTIYTLKVHPTTALDYNQLVLLLSNLCDFSRIMLTETVLEVASTEMIVQIIPLQRS